jgi:hypothetical protein
MLKMWDIRDGSVVRDLLTGVWQVMFEGRCTDGYNHLSAYISQRFTSVDEHR